MQFCEGRAGLALALAGLALAGLWALAGSASFRFRGCGPLGSSVRAGGAFVAQIGTHEGVCVFPISAPKAEG